MKLSSRSRYGLRAILELAVEYGNGPLQIKTIAEREDISNKYLEQLVAMLKASGLVRSIRGPKGGYELTRPPGDVKLSEVFTTLEGPVVAVDPWSPSSAWSIRSSVPGAPNASPGRSGRRCIRRSWTCWSP